MLLSMTGFGHSSLDQAGIHVSAEIKSVNNRYLKLVTRLPDSLARFESEIEKLIRSKLSRGSVQLLLRVRLPVGQSDHRIDVDALRGYREQLSVLELAGDRQLVTTGELLQLPGVVIESELPEELISSLWPVSELAIGEALDHLQEFRRHEGESMQVELARQCAAIERELQSVVLEAPRIITEYRDKLLERIRRLMGEAAGTISENDLIREVAVFADRCDINEEITRLRSHLHQFDRLLQSDVSQGRKLEFIGQEMFREINTIGSKANSVAIAHAVVEMKAAIERIREVLQNIE